MKKCTGEPSNNYLELPLQEQSNIKNIIAKNPEEFLDFIHKLGLSVEHKSKTVHAQNTSYTVLTLRTTCFEVDINENFAKIAPLK
jgi:hypothetical protein